MTDSKNINISITKDQLTELPTVNYPGHISVIDTENSAKSAIHFLSNQKIVGFDTETRPSFRKGKRYNVSLIQISTINHCFLFRINKLGFIDELKQLLEIESIIKIGLSLKDDFAVLRKIADFAPKGFIDLQSFVKQYNIMDCSLQKIYAIIFNERISKNQRLSNWEAEELSISQQNYASIDAWACLRIYRHLCAGEFNPLRSPYILTQNLIKPNLPSHN